MNRKPEYNLAERTVIITGAAGGIGAATAREVVARGALVTLVDLSRDAVSALAKRSPPVAHQLTPPTSPSSTPARSPPPSPMRPVGTMPPPPPSPNTPSADPLRFIEPEEIATAVADGIQTRVAKIIQPRIWRPISALRGIVAAATDAVMRRDRTILHHKSQLEREATTHQYP